MAINYNDSNKFMATVSFYEGYINHLWNIVSLSSFDEYENETITESNNLSFVTNTNHKESSNFNFSYNCVGDHSIWSINKSVSEFWVPMNCTNDVIMKDQLRASHTHMRDLIVNDLDVDVRTLHLNNLIMHNLNLDTIYAHDITTNNFSAQTLYIRSGYIQDIYVSSHVNTSTLFAHKCALKKELLCKNALTKHIHTEGVINTQNLISQNVHVDENMNIPHLFLCDILGNDNTITDNTVHIKHTTAIDEYGVYINNVVAHSFISRHLDTPLINVSEFFCNSSCRMQGTFLVHNHCIMNDATFSNVTVQSISNSNLYTSWFKSNSIETYSLDCDDLTCQSMMHIHSGSANDMFCHKYSGQSLHTHALKTSSLYVDHMYSHANVNIDADIYIYKDLITNAISFDNDHHMLYGKANELCINCALSFHSLYVNFYTQSSISVISHKTYIKTTELSTNSVCCAANMSIQSQLYLKQYHIPYISDVSTFSIHNSHVLILNDTHIQVNCHTSLPEVSVQLPTQLNSDIYVNNLTCHVQFNSLFIQNSHTTYTSGILSDVTVSSLNFQSCVIETLDVNSLSCQNIQANCLDCTSIYSSNIFTYSVECEHLYLNEQNMGDVLDNLFYNSSFHINQIHFSHNSYTIDTNVQVDSVVCSTLQSNCINNALSNIEMTETETHITSHSLLNMSQLSVTNSSSKCSYLSCTSMSTHSIHINDLNAYAAFLHDVNFDHLNTFSATLHDEVTFHSHTQWNSDVHVNGDMYINDIQCNCNLHIKSLMREFYSNCAVFNSNIITLSDTGRSGIYINNLSGPSIVYQNNTWSMNTDICLPTDTSFRIGNDWKVYHDVSQFSLEFAYKDSVKMKILSEIYPSDWLVPTDPTANLSAHIFIITEDANNVSFIFVSNANASIPLSIHKDMSEFNVPVNINGVGYIKSAISNGTTHLHTLHIHGSSLTLQNAIFNNLFVSSSITSTRIVTHDQHLQCQINTQNLTFHTGYISQLNNVISLHTGRMNTSHAHLYTCEADSMHCNTIHSQYIYSHIIRTSKLFVTSDMHIQLDLHVRQTDEGDTNIDGNQIYMKNMQFYPDIHLLNVIDYGDLCGTNLITQSIATQSTTMNSTHMQNLNVYGFSSIHHTICKNVHVHQQCHTNVLTSQSCHFNTLECEKLHAQKYVSHTIPANNIMRIKHLHVNTIENETYLQSDVTIPSTLYVSSPVYMQQLKCKTLYANQDVYVSKVHMDNFTLSQNSGTFQLNDNMIIHPDNISLNQNKIQFDSDTVRTYQDVHIFNSVYAGKSIKCHELYPLFNVSILDHVTSFNIAHNPILYMDENIHIHEPVQCQSIISQHPVFIHNSIIISSSLHASVYAHNMHVSHDMTFQCAHFNSITILNNHLHVDSLSTNSLISTSMVCQDLTVSSATFNSIECNTLSCKNVNVNYIYLNDKLIDSNLISDMYTTDSIHINDVFELNSTSAHISSISCSSVDTYMLYSDYLHVNNISCNHDTLYCHNSRFFSQNEYGNTTLYANNFVFHSQSISQLEAHFNQITCDTLHVSNNVNITQPTIDYTKANTFDSVQLQSTHVSDNTTFSNLICQNDLYIHGKTNIKIPIGASYNYRGSKREIQAASQYILHDHESNQSQTGIYVNNTHNSPLISYSQNTFMMNADINITQSHEFRNGPWSLCINDDSVFHISYNNNVKLKLFHTHI